MHLHFIKNAKFLFFCITAVTSTGTTYEESVIDKIFGKLLESIPLPTVYFSVRNPFNASSTQFRFNMTNGTLHMRGTEDYNASIGGCSFNSKWNFGFCHLPIVGSFATYNCSLYYGKNVVQNFSTTVTADEYPMEWNNPADISAYLYLNGANGFTLSEIRVTEFMLNTTASPPFSNFTFRVFEENEALTDYVWYNFTERMYRTVKLDMKKYITKEYTRQIKERVAALRVVNKTLLYT